MVHCYSQAALGRESDPVVVLDERRRTIRDLRRQLARYDNPRTGDLSKGQERHRQAVANRIARLEAFVRTLAALQEQKEKQAA